MIKAGQPWQFATPASIGNEATYKATTIAAGLNSPILSRGAGFSTTGSTLGRGFTSNAAVVIATKTDAHSQNGYYQFTLSAQSTGAISLQSLNAHLRRSAAGANVYRWAYSFDGTNFTDVGPADVSFTPVDDAGDDQPPIDLSSVAALQNVAFGTTITFRLYGWGFGNINSGTFAIGRSTAGTTMSVLSVTGLIQ